jgi:predicted HicB family RNase H-like nuclease
MKDVLTYKGYIATVRYSAEDDILHGKLEGIDDLVSFDGRSIDELKKAFKEAVDDYVEYCKKIGKEPERVCKGSFNIRITPELHRKAVQQASVLGISLNQLVQKAIEKAVIRDEISRAKTRKRVKVA